MADNWYYAQGQQRVGPMSADELKQRLPGIGGAEALVYGPGMQNWMRAGDVAPLYASTMAPSGGPPPLGGGGGADGGPHRPPNGNQGFGREEAERGCTPGRGGGGNRR